MTFTFISCSFRSDDMAAASSPNLRSALTPPERELGEAERDELVVRHPAEPAGEPVREVEHRRDLRDVHHVLVRPAGLAEPLDVALRARRRLLGQLDREVEHRALTRL